MAQPSTFQTSHAECDSDCLSQQQHAPIGGLVAAFKINCEFLAANRWKVERKRRIVVHGGCGGALMHIAICLDNDLLRESRSWRYSRRKILIPHA
jgi:hypothetical protein